MTKPWESVLAVWVAQEEDDKMELTPKEAITVIRNLQDWLYFSSMNGGTKIQREALDIAVKALERQIQAEESFEWCDGCKEYDQEQHCCHRWSKMIRKTVEEMRIVRCKDCKYAEYIDDVKTLWCTECGQGRTVAPYDFCSYAERRDDDVTCDNCDYSEKYTDGLILCRRTKTSHQVSATSTCGKGKREAKDELQKTSNDE